MENSTTKLAHIIQANRPAILEAWQQQLIVNARPLVAELGLNTVKQKTDQVLRLLCEALMQEAETDTERFAETYEMLDAIIRQVDLINLSFEEIATFILALKAVLYSLLVEKAGLAPVDYVLPVTARFDNLLLHCFSFYLETREELIREQQRAFMEVSVPVVRLWQQIIMIPLVGMLDSSRTQQMMETMLGALEEYQSKVAILDISGIPVVDTLVARHLITAASAARLMGAECIITGIRAKISQTLVQLGVDLSGFITRSTLSDGLQLALKLTDQKIG